VERAATVQITAACLILIHPLDNKTWRVSSFR
jgi:hypothetical protein